MFDKLRDGNKLVRAQSRIKKELEQIFEKGEKGNIVVLVRGDKRIESINIDGDEQKVLKDLLNDTMKEAEKKSEKKLRGQLGDLGFPGL